MVNLNSKCPRYVYVSTFVSILMASESPVEHFLLQQVTFKCGVPLTTGDFPEDPCSMPPPPLSNPHDIYHHVNTLKELRKSSFLLPARSACCGHCLQHRCLSSQSS